MHLPEPLSRVCPVCGDPEQRLLRDHPLAPVEGVSLHAGYQVVACPTCGMVYAEGVPAQEAFDRYYQACSRYEDNLRQGVPSAVDQARFHTIAGELAQSCPDRTISIAEIGSSTGGLLAELAGLGYTRLLGVDPSAQCGQSAQDVHGVAVAQGTIFDPLAQSPHDLVIAVGVLEHIRDLDKALANLRGSLSEKGLLYLEVPDLEGFHLTNEAPFQEFSTEHISFFTERSLDNLMGRAGFERAFGGLRQRVHSGGSAMRVVAAAYRKSAPKPFVPDLAGPEAALAYAALCQTQTLGERHQAEQLAQAGHPVALWGAGTVACRLLATTALDQAFVAGIVDSNPHLQDRTLGGIGIHAPAWLKDFDGPILIASRGYEAEIRRTILEDLGLANEILSLG